MKRLLIIVFALLAANTPALKAQVLLPYQNPDLTAQQRAKDLCSRLTIEEKAQIMMDVSREVKRMDIPHFDWWNEALHGVGRNGFATVFPITMCMASSWNDDLLYHVFDAVSDELRAKNNDARRNGTLARYRGVSIWTPNINIFRDPRWGRGQETYGEDPFLTTRMGLAVVRGLQGPSDSRYYKTLACAKHFAVHSGPEWNRHYFNVEDVPARDLWETYLPAFKALVQDGNVREVMCAYQRIDGDPCCGSNRYLQQILRDEWKFNGLVVSDCGAVDDFWREGRHGVSADAKSASAKAVLSGTDVECGSNYRNLPDAVRNGLITEEQINRSVVRLLKARFEVGDFDSDDIVEWRKIGNDVIASPEHKQLALDMARQGIVLLQNRNNALPLSKSAKVAVVGPNATNVTMLWGNYSGYPTQRVSLLDGLKAMSANVSYIPGCDYCHNVSLASRFSEIYNADGTQGMKGKYWNTPDLPASSSSDAPVATVNYSSALNLSNGGATVFAPGVNLENFSARYEGIFRPTRSETVQFNIAALAKAGRKVIFINCSGSAIALTPEAEACDAVVQAWYGGEMGPQALAEVIYGDVNPSGKLPITFYRDDSQLPDFLDYTMANRTYRYFRGTPLWAFGHGLSYTSFAMSGAKYNNKKGELTFSITNTGKLDGTEVAQVYIRRIADTAGPIKSLRAYQRISVKAGETKQVTVSLPRNQFECWDESVNAMRIIPGKYEVMLANSSDDANMQMLVVTIK